MKKIEVGANPYMYPMPTVLVGAHVNNKPNYRTIAYCSMVQISPPVVAIGMGSGAYTGEGIKEAQGFSVNIPSEDMVTLVDYCGIVSGKDKDKSRLFKNFYGKLGNVPMIEECPVSLECKLLKVVSLNGNHELFLGEIVEIYCNEEATLNGKPDIQHVKPILFSCGDKRYYKTGEPFATAWKIGKDFKD